MTPEFAASIFLTKYRSFRIVHLSTCKAMPPHSLSMERTTCTLTVLLAHCPSLSRPPPPPSIHLVIRDPEFAISHFKPNKILFYFRPFDGPVEKPRKDGPSNMHVKIIAHAPSLSGHSVPWRRVQWVSDFRGPRSPPILPLWTIPAAAMAVGGAPCKWGEPVGQVRLRFFACVFPPIHTFLLLSIYGLE